MKFQQKLLPLLFLGFANLLCGQSPLTENTLKLDRPENAPAAKIEDLAWLAGHWTGEGFGGQIEENWTPPMAGTMQATFKMAEGGLPVFYEICLIAPEGNSLVYKVKHFNPDFTAWEEKADFVTFPLVKIGPNAVWFQGLTMILEGNKTCHLYLALEQKDGSVLEEKLIYSRP